MYYWVDTTPVWAIEVAAEALWLIAGLLMTIVIGPILVVAATAARTGSLPAK